MHGQLGWGEFFHWKFSALLLTSIIDFEAIALVISIATYSIHCKIDETCDVSHKPVNVGIDFLKINVSMIMVIHKKKLAHYSYWVCNRIQFGITINQYARNHHVCSRYRMEGLRECYNIIIILYMSYTVTSPRGGAPRASGCIKPYSTNLPCYVL